MMFIKEVKESNLIDGVKLITLDTYEDNRCYIATVFSKSSLYPEWDMKAIVQQLVGKQIAKKKLPTWFQNNEVLYPVRLSMEQCSSEATAKYKTTIINSGRGIDLTGGFGVDTIFLSKQSESVIYCERNEYLASLFNHNFKVLNQHNCDIHVGNGVEYLKNLKKLDWIFIDPSRRKESQKVYRLEDCEPTVFRSKNLKSGFSLIVFKNQELRYFFRFTRRRQMGPARR